MLREEAVRNELPALMTVAETAAALSVSTKTVRRMLEDGRIVAHRIGTNVRVNASSVMHLLWAPPVPASEQQVQEKDEVEVMLGRRLRYTQEFTGTVGGMEVALGTADADEARALLQRGQRAWDKLQTRKDRLERLKSTSFIVQQGGRARFIKYRGSDGSKKTRRIPAEHVEALVDPVMAQGYALRWALLQSTATDQEPSFRGVALHGVAPSQSGATTVANVAKKWFTGELTATYGEHYVREKKTARSDEIRFNRYIGPAIGGLPVASLRGERAAEAADQIILRMQEIAPGLSAATQRHVLQVFSRILKLAVFPLRLLPSNDLPPGYLPKARTNKAFSYVYPDEDAAVLACRRVPLFYRMYFGILAREGLRASELRNLEWSDLDLERGILRLDSNKTGMPRAWKMDPGVVEALVRWKKLLPGKILEKGGVIVEPKTGRKFPQGKTADRLQGALVSAGVTRAELFEATADRMAIRGHDLRSTFVTVSLALGKTEAWVTDRTGHTSSTMLYRYKRAARTHLETELGALRPLHEAIPELAQLG